MFPTFIIYLLLETLTVVFVIFCIAAYRVYYSEDHPIATVNIQELKNGDIIGIANFNSNPFIKFVRAWSMSIWNHVGIVYVDEFGEKFVLEAMAYRALGKRGMFKLPLKEWMHLNRRSLMGVSTINKEVNPVELLEAFTIMKNHASLDPYGPDWYRLALRHVFNSKNQRLYTCSEIAVTILQQIGVVSYETACSSYFPGECITGRMDMVQGYSYEYPRELKPLVEVTTSS